MSRGKKYIEVSTELLVEAIFKDTPAKTVNLPNDVRFERMWREKNGATFAFVLSSEEWRELSEGEEIPQTEAMITERYERLSIE